MIDSHAHLSFQKFENDVEEVIKDSFDFGIKAIIDVGTQVSSSIEAVKIAQAHENVYASVGLHPHHADKHEDNWLEQLEKLVKEEKVVAIGECGMDFFSYKTNGVVDPKKQEEVFRQQIELSINYSLPLQIHNRHAGKDTLKILKDYKSRFLEYPGVFHCFAGDLEVLKGALELGFFIGFDGNITYSGLAPGETVELKEIALHTPLDRVMIETDSPYLAPVPHRGERNTPKNAIITAQFIASLKKIPYTEFESVIYQNFGNLFRIKV